MEKKYSIFEFKQDLNALLKKYNASITTSKAQCLMEYPAITFKIKNKEYWSEDKDGFPASEIDCSNVEDIILKQ